MQCPKCPGALRPQRVGEVEVDRCERCGGLWLDVGELPRLVTQSSLPRSPAIPNSPQHNVITAPCPRCGGQGHMTRLHRNEYPLVIDSCPVCYGVWLDAGELGKLSRPPSWRDRIRRVLRQWQSVTE